MKQKIFIGTSFHITEFFRSLTNSNHSTILKARTYYCFVLILTYLLWNLTRDSRRPAPSSVSRSIRSLKMPSGTTAARAGMRESRRSRCDFSSWVEFSRSAEKSKNKIHYLTSFMISRHWWIICKILAISSKLQTFCRWLFQIYFPKWKWLYFVKFCFKGYYSNISNIKRTQSLK